MSLLVENYFIPGFRYLTTEERELFEKTEAASAIKKTKELLTQNFSTSWKSFFRLAKPQDEALKLKKQCDERRKILFESRKIFQKLHANESETLHFKIKHRMLLEAYPPYNHLIANDQRLLLEHPITEKLFIELNSVDKRLIRSYQALNELKGLEKGAGLVKIKELEEQREEAVRNWQGSFHSLEELKPINEKLTLILSALDNKFKKKITQIEGTNKEKLKSIVDARRIDLKKFFPECNYSLMANYFIPGFRYLTSEEQENFEESEAGLALEEELRDICESFASSWRTFFGLVNNKDEILKIKAHCEIRRKKFLEVYEENCAELQVRIKHQMLLEAYPNYVHLPSNDQNILLNHKITHDLFRDLTILDKRLIRLYSAKERKGMDADILDKIKKTEQQRQEKLLEWGNKFNELDELAPITERLREKLEILAEEYRQKMHLQKAIDTAKRLAVLEPRINNLKEMFPIIDHPIFSEDEYPIINLLDKYMLELKKDNPQCELREEEWLTEIIFSFLKTTIGDPIPYINLQQFNFNESAKAARFILTSLRKGNKPVLESWINHYEASLFAYMEKKLFLTPKHKPWKKITSPNSSNSLQSLAQCFLSSKLGTDIGNFLTLYGDAHMALQGIGAATQNEGSWLGIMDMVNYVRFAPQIAENKMILRSFLLPFLPIYYEYKTIALYEKNSLRKLFRILIPLCIFMGFIIIVSAWLATFALPELVFTFTLIPIIFVALILTTLYISLKNMFHKSLRELYYGGPFEVPEFKVNQRMIAAFGTEQKANSVRLFYIQELIKCQRKHKKWKEKEKNTMLTSDDLTKRESNIARLEYLNLEWYDIHSNSKLGVNEVSLLVLNQLIATHNSHLDEASLHWDKTEKVSIKTEIHNLCHELKTNLTTDTDADIDANPNHRLHSARAEQKHSSAFFCPQKFFENKKRAEKIANLATSLSPTPLVT